MSKEQGLTNEQIMALRDNLSIGYLFSHLSNRSIGGERFCGTNNDHLFLSNNGTWVDMKQKQSECLGDNNEQLEQ